MSRSFRNLTEQQIRKAEAEGKLSGLAGEGRPLPRRPEDALVDAGMAAGHRIMAEAGVRPEEFALKEQLLAAQRAYLELPNGAEREAAMRCIADLELRYNIAREARRRFFR